MTTLANYPNVNQNSAKINPLFDCVPAAIIDGMEYLTGQHIDIDAMVTACYGPNWHGATSAARYVDFCALHGVLLAPIDGDPPTLVVELHRQIQAGHPCLLTEPDMYAPAHPDWSHVLSVYSEAAFSLTARDPFSTRDVTHTDADWAALLRYREIWTMEVLTMPLSIDMPEVAALFRQLDANHWQSLKTGRILQFGLLESYKAGGVASLETLGDVESPELVQPHGDVIQYHRLGITRWIKATGKVARVDMFNPGASNLPRIMPPQQPAPDAPQSTALLLHIAEEVATAVGKKLV